MNSSGSHVRGVVLTRLRSGKVIVGAPDASVKGSLGKFFGSVSYAFGFGGR